MKIQTTKEKIASLRERKISEIFKKDINLFNDIVNKDQKHPKVNFLRDLVQLIRDPKICFGATDEKNANAYYSSTNGTVYININPEVRALKALCTSTKVESEEELIGSISHEFIHCYDDKVLKMENFFHPLYEKIVANLGGEKEPTVVNGMMESIATILHGVRDGVMQEYADKYSCLFDSDSKSCEYNFRLFMGEIIPNICSEISADMNYTNHLTSALNAETVGKKTQKYLQHQKERKHLNFCKIFSTNTKKLSKI